MRGEEQRRRGKGDEGGIQRSGGEVGGVKVWWRMLIG